MGSRAFYEGWDSNRPNVMNFINIGSRDAKKFEENTARLYSGNEAREDDR